MDILIHLISGYLWSAVNVYVASLNQLVIYHDWSWSIMTDHDKSPDFIIKNHQTSPNVKWMFPIKSPPIMGWPKHPMHIFFMNPLMHIISWQTHSPMHILIATLALFKHYFTHFWAHLCILHGGLLCVAFWPSVCQLFELDNNSYHISESITRKKWLEVHAFSAIISPILIYPSLHHMLRPGCISP